MKRRPIYSDDRTLRIRSAANGAWELQRFNAELDASAECPPRNRKDRWETQGRAMSFDVAMEKIRGATKK